jgi:hypothetical protein
MCTRVCCKNERKTELTPDPPDRAQWQASVAAVLMLRVLLPER